MVGRSLVVKGRRDKIWAHTQIFAHVILAPPDCKTPKIHECNTDASKVYSDSQKDKEGEKIAHKAHILEAGRKIIFRGQTLGVP